MFPVIQCEDARAQAEGVKVRQKKKPGWEMTQIAAGCIQLPQVQPGWHRVRQIFELAIRDVEVRQCDCAEGRQPLE